MKDEFYLLCAEIRRQCDANINKDSECLDENRAACGKALARFDAELEPALARILDICGKESPEGREAREEAAFCLHELAKDHVWAEEYDTAERLIARAREMALSSSIILRRIEETVSVLAHKADVQEKRAALWEELPRPAASGRTAGRWWPWMAAAAVTIIIAAGISYHLGWKSAERHQEISARPLDAMMPAPEEKTVEKPAAAKAKAKTSFRQKHLHRAKSTSRASDLRKYGAGGKVTLAALKSRIEASQGALAILEEKLVRTVRQLDEMEKSFERDWTAIENYNNRVAAGQETDAGQCQLTIDTYSSNVRRYYDLLDEANLTADEHDKVLKETWRLVGQYRKRVAD